MANFCSGVKVRLFGGAAGSMSSSVTSSFWARSIKGVELVKVMVSVLPVSPWREERLRQVSHVSLTDRGATWPSGRPRGSRTPPPSTRTVRLWRIRSEVRGSFSQEGQVLVLFSDLSAQPDQLRPFRRAQRLIARAGQCLDPAPLIADPGAEGTLQDREFTGDLSNRSVRVDDSMRRLGLELEGELPSCDCHGDILPAASSRRPVGCPLFLGSLTPAWRAVELRVQGAANLLRPDG